MTVENAYDTIQLQQGNAKLPLRFQGTLLAELDARPWPDPYVTGGKSSREVDALRVFLEERGRVITQTEQRPGSGSLAVSFEVRVYDDVPGFIRAHLLSPHGKLALRALTVATGDRQWDAATWERLPSPVYALSGDVVSCRLLRDGGADVSFEGVELFPVRSPFTRTIRGSSESWVQEWRAYFTGEVVVLTLAQVALSAGGEVVRSQPGGVYVITGPGDVITLLDRGVHDVVGTEMHGLERAWFLSEVIARLESVLPGIDVCTYEELPPPYTEPEPEPDAWSEPAFGEVAPAPFTLERCLSHLQELAAQGVPAALAALLEYENAHPGTLPSEDLTDAS